MSTYETHWYDILKGKEREACQQHLKAEKEMVGEK